MKTEIFSRTTLAIALGLALTLGAGTVCAETLSIDSTESLSAPQAKGKCIPTEQKYRSTQVQTSTNSTKYVLVPSSKFRFRQDSKKAKCVLVHVSAMAGTDSDQSLHIRAVIDGGLAEAEPGTVLLVHEIPAPVQRAVTFIFPSVAPGKHIIELQYKSSDGGIVGLFGRVVTVEHY
jgi:hypothetical protein